MKIVLAIGAGIVISIATFMVGLIVAIPAVVAAVVAVIAGKNVGLDWNVLPSPQPSSPGASLRCAVLRGGPDFRSGDCLLPCIFDLLLCAALQDIERPALSTSAIRSAGNS